MDHRYNIKVFWSRGNDCWISDVPDLRLCLAHGDTPVDALTEAKVMTAVWPGVARDRGLPIPGPHYRPAIYSS